MCYITATQLKANLGYYLELSQTEDVFITKNNRVISVLSNADSKKMEAVEKLYNFKGGKHKSDDIDYDELILKEIKRRCGY